MKRRLGLLLAVTVAATLLMASVALAQTGGSTYQADLATLNDSGASGNATVTVEGNQATVNIQSSGLTPGQPHAQHIHIGGQNVCPPASADTDGSGAISVAEGKPFYGGIPIALTTTGDISGDSALAVDRMPVADSAGNINYSRTFTLPEGVSPEQIANGVIVEHGIDFNANGEYDTSAGQSSIMPDLPFEATAPADCGELVAQTGGGALPDTGGVSPASSLPLAGGAALLMAGVAGYLGLRRALR